ncbi:MAG: hypothetical protein KTR24_16010 [Saprospiraceae bacterium]|nr:hypothetical protein [Saprospiraceae bacterium]
MKKLPLSFLVGAAFLLVLACQPDTNPHHASHLGDISIDVSGTEEAVSAFKEGLLLLHSFEYVDAADKFREAQQLDSTCTMAYWGEAMTHNHPLWREQKTTKALEILERLGKDAETRASLISSEFERDLFQAAEVLFTSDTDKKVRDQHYAEYMKGLHEKYPSNHEIGSLYALSLLGAVKAGRDYEQYAKGAKIAEGIIAENPNHPGALHYLIHSYDDPDNAPKALFAANSYAKVAPDAGHALHMPSHIYVAMGMWDEVISSNIASWEAGVSRKERKELTNDALNYHALLWLSYGYLQKEQFEDARRCVEMMQEFCIELPSNRAKSHVIYMKGAYFTETQQWDDILLQDTFDYTHLNVAARNTALFLEGMTALTQDKLSVVKEIADQMQVNRVEASKQAEASGAVMCAGRYNQRYSTPSEVKKSKVIELELRALLADAEENAAKAEQFLSEAVALEEETTFQFGPPKIVKPSTELFGEWLLKNDRLNEAKVQFEKTLERAPERFLARKGLLQSTKGSS